jgi:hypothetical protein
MILLISQGTLERAERTDTYRIARLVTFRLHTKTSVEEVPVNNGVNVNPTVSPEWCKFQIVGLFRSLDEHLTELLELLIIER